MGRGCEVEAPSDPPAAPVLRLPQSCRAVDPAGHLLDALEKAIQSAFHDVADALAGRATYTRQMDAEAKLVDADQRFYNLSKMRSDAGADTYLNVVVAQNSLFAAEINLIALNLAEQQNLVTLYKSLGGGWTDRVQSPQ